MTKQKAIDILENILSADLDRELCPPSILRRMQAQNADATDTLRGRVSHWLNFIEAYKTTEADRVTIVDQCREWAKWAR